MRAEPRTRTPLQAQPLRVAGQSLSEEIDEFRYDHGVVPAVAAVMMSLLAAMEWFRFLTNARPTPWIYSGMAALAVGYAAFKVRRTRQQLKNLRLGAMPNAQWRSTSNGFGPRASLSFTMCPVPTPTSTMC